MAILKKQFHYYPHPSGVWQDYDHDPVTPAHVTQSGLSRALQFPTISFDLLPPPIIPELSWPKATGVSFQGNPRGDPQGYALWHPWGLAHEAVYTDYEGYGNLTRVPSDGVSTRWVAIETVTEYDYSYRDDSGTHWEDASFGGNRLFILISPFDCEYVNPVGSPSTRELTIASEDDAALESVIAQLYQPTGGTRIKSGKLTCYVAFRWYQTFFVVLGRGVVGGDGYGVHVGGGGCTG